MEASRPKCRHEVPGRAAFKAGKGCARATPALVEVSSFVVGSCGLWMSLTVHPLVETVMRDLSSASAQCLKQLKSISARPMHGYSHPFNERQADHEA
jgi:hypothetical protein